MNRDFKALELDKILQRLSEEASCADTQALALDIEPSYGLFEVKEQLKQTNDAFMLIGRFGSPSFGGCKNVTNALFRARAGGCLTATELLRISETLRVIRSLKEWKSHSAGVETSLDMIFNALVTNKFLEDKINNAIVSEDEISDSASPELNDIRRKIRTESSKVRELLDKIIRSTTFQKYLQENIVTQRDGRFVVPVKSEFRGNVAGLVHDTSSSGSTVFIEPMGVVQANNEIKLLKAKEEAEIERILFELSATVGSFAESINDSYKYLIDIDLIFAKAKLGYKMKASMPIVNDKGYIDLHKARHPLISDDKVVATDISLGKDYDTLVITGPNTGGKTVSIKTVGLLSLMAMCGLMIPAAENSHTSVFKKILADIGDEQSIEQSLSTFSAHITNIIRILSQTNRSTLVLIDELGAGTDPVEGAALAISILEKMREKGAKIVSTTHYAELKEYALRTDRVENGCCEFDVATLRPTYRLLIGVMGKSNAFAISLRLGIDKDIIDKAEQLVSTENRQFEDVVMTLENQRQELERNLKEVSKSKIEADKAKELAKLEVEKAKENAQKEIEKARFEAQQIVAKTKAHAQALMDSIEQAQKQKQLSADDKAKLRKNIKQMEETADPITKKEAQNYTLPRPLKQYDNVLIYDIDKKAVVLETPAKDAKFVSVQIGILKSKVEVSRIRLIKQEEKITINGQKRDRTVTSKIDVRATTEVDVRGMTAVEAIDAVDSAIDSAILTNINILTIIHGKGTGVLRREIQLFLKKHKFVKSYRLGVYGEGEDGVTIVEF